MKLIKFVSEKKKKIAICQCRRTEGVRMNQGSNQETNEEMKYSR